MIFYIKYKILTRHFAFIAVSVAQKNVNAIFHVQIRVLAITIVATVHFWNEWNVVPFTYDEATL